MIEKMTRWSFILLRGDEDMFLTRLQGLGMVDITRSAVPVDEKSASLLSRVDSIKKTIDKFETLSFEDEPDFKSIDSYILGAVEDPVKETAFVLQKIEELKSLLSAANDERESRLQWGCFDAASISELENNGIKIRFYSVRAKDFDENWASEYYLTEISRTQDRVWFVTVSDDPAYSFPIDELPAPEADYLVSDKKINEYEQELMDCKRRLNALKKQYEESLRQEYIKTVSKLDRYLAGISGTEAADGHLVILDGFAPTENDEAMKNALEDFPVLCLTQEATQQDNPPIKLKNNSFVDMFSVLTDMYGRPSYNEFDPTGFISVFFTLFFAFCMGDAGYGLVVMLAALVLRKTSLRSVSSLVLTLGIATTVIGFVFHSFFSVDISQLAWIQNLGLDSLMVPSDKVEVPGMGAYDWNMMLALACGVVHISLAQMTKAYIATRNEGFLSSLGTWGWTLLIVGAVAVGAFALLGVLDMGMAKIAIIVVGIISALCIFLLRDIHKNPLLNIGAGLWETYNTATGLLSDVLSYLRLYALGLAGSLLGSAFNDLAGMVRGDGGVGGWIFFILLVVIGHTLNIAMSGLSAFVHPLRLNFLEFFKNAGYGGMGRNFSPLKEEV